MQKRQDQDNDQNESFFERWLRQERLKKFAQNEGLFFGACVLFALYATQGMFTI